MRLRSEVYLDPFLKWVGGRDLLSSCNIECNEESNEESWEVLRAFIYPVSVPSELSEKIGGSLLLSKSSHAISTEIC